MSYILLRKMKVQKADGSYEERQPGDPVPEAANWPNPALWVKRGFIRPADGKTIVQGERATRKPMRAVTEKDLLDWQAKKSAREEGGGEGSPFEGGGQAADGDGKITADELHGMKKDALIEFAQANGIEVDTGASKKDIAQQILDAQG